VGHECLGNFGATTASNIEGCC